MQRGEEFPYTLIHARRVILQIVPRCRICQYIPTYRIRPLAFKLLERIYGIAQTLTHLVPLLVENKPIRDNMLKRHRVRHHRRDGMKGKEPPSCLIDSLGNEVRGEMGVKSILVLKRIVPLRVGHRPRVKPNINEVWFAIHRLPIRRYKNDIIHVGAMDIYGVIIRI